MDKKDQIRHMEDRIVEEMKQIFDPEIPVNIYDLGLIYGIEVTENLDARVTMTLTSPNCPEAESLPLKVENALKSIRNVKSAEVVLTFEPPWEKEMMSESAMLELGFL
jgi:FeS assembly SUF system protein